MSETDLSREFVKILHAVPDPATLGQQSESAADELRLAIGLADSGAADESPSIHDAEGPDIPENDLDVFTLDELEDESRW